MSFLSQLLGQLPIVGGGNSSAGPLDVQGEANAGAEVRQGAGEAIENDLFRARYGVGSGDKTDFALSGIPGGGAGIDPGSAALGPEQLQDAQRESAAYLSTQNLGPTTSALGRVARESLGQFGIPGFDDGDRTEELRDKFTNAQSRAISDNYLKDFAGGPSAAEQFFEPRGGADRHSFFGESMKPTHVRIKEFLEDAFK